MIFEKQEHKKELLQIIKNLSYEKRDVVLASGKKSDFYIDVKQTALNSRGAYLIACLINEIISKKFPKSVAVGGITMGADPLATATAVVSELISDVKKQNSFYIRKEPKAHGTCRWIEGSKNLPEAADVVILEDVITTGGSTLKACERAKEAGLNILGIISVVDRQEGAVETINKAGYDIISIFTKQDIV